MDHRPFEDWLLEINTLPLNKSGTAGPFTSMYFMRGHC